VVVNCLARETETKRFASRVNDRGDWLSPQSGEIFIEKRTLHSLVQRQGKERFYKYGAALQRGKTDNY
jgi:hypothetical protein